MLIRAFIQEVLKVIARVREGIEPQAIAQLKAVAEAGSLVVAKNHIYTLEDKNDKFKKNHPIKQRIYGEDRFCMAYKEI